MPLWVSITLPISACVLGAILAVIVNKFFL